jgi:D-glycero-D-manno-heptose 1,7-bisphosphate phosphatase
VQTIHSALREMLQKEGASIDGMYFCPHHPKGNPPYNILCSCRKPAAGMLRQAAKDLDIDLKKSVVIGDKISDVQTAQGLQRPGILVLTGFGKDEQEKYQGNWEKAPDYIAENLLEAVSWFLKNSSFIEKG